MDPNKHQWFKQRMQQLKEYKQNNPDKGYWDWINSLPSFEGGGVKQNDGEEQSRKWLRHWLRNRNTQIKNILQDTRTDHKMPLIQSIDLDIHTTLDGEYNPFYNSYTDTYGTVPLKGVEIVAPLTQQARRKIEARRGARYIDEGKRKAAPYVGTIVGGAVASAMSSAGLLWKTLDAANILMNPTDPTNYVRIPNIRLGRWSAKFPEYGNPKKTFRQVHLDALDDYYKSGVVRPEQIEHNMKRRAENAVPGIQRLIVKHFDNHVMFNKQKPFYGIDSKHKGLLVGDLNNTNINWTKVNHKGHKYIVDPINPKTGNFDVSINEFDVWRKKHFGWLKDKKIK